LGAVIANYAQVTGFVTAGDHLDAALVRDMITDAELTLRAKVVVNAAGPWVDGVRMLQGDSERPRLHLTKGIHLIVLRSRLPVSHIVIMTTADRRVVFAVPREDLVYIGTTDTNYPAADDDPPVTVEDAQYLLDAANATFAIEPLGLRDIVGAWAGLRPLLHQEGKKPTEISRKDEIMVGPTGLVSIAGGKLTTYRKMAERVVDVALERLTKAGEPAPLKKGESEDERLSGGETGADIDAFAARLQQRWPQVAPDIVHRLVEVYGSNGERMVETMVGDPQLARRCTPGLALTRCEVAYAVREEMAMTLEDFLERRARLFLWDQHNGLTAASEVARWMGKLLGWDARRIDDEIAAYERHVREVKGFLLEPDAVAAPRVAHA
jgi:glycerol-3-phosphate dehydrogenase